MLDQGPQRIAMRGNDDRLAFAQLRQDGLFPIGQHALDRQFEALGARYVDPGISRVVREVEFAALFELGRGNVEAAAPDMHLLVTVLLAGFLLVESGQAAVVALVEVPVARDRDPQPVAGLEREVERLDRAFLDAGEGDGGQHVLGAHQLARLARFGFTFFGKVDVPPAGETVGEVPLALTVADEDQLAHFLSRFPCRSGPEQRLAFARKQ